MAISNNTLAKAGTITGATLGITIDLTLNVLGAAGAVWGPSEVAGLRTEENKELWKKASMVAGGLGLVVYILDNLPITDQTTQAEGASSQQNSSNFFPALRHACQQPYSAIYNVFFKTEESSNSSPQQATTVSDDNAYQQLLENT